MNVTARLRELDEAILARRAQNTIDSGQRAAPRFQDRLTQVNPNRRNGRIIRSQGRAKVNHMKNETETRNAPASVVVTASSAGGMRALSTILSRLPPNFPAALIAVQHRAPGPPYLLSEILRKRTDLDVKDAIEGDTLARGTVYLARPESHLVVRGDGTLRYTDGTRYVPTRMRARRRIASGRAALGRFARSSTMIPVRGAAKSRIGEIPRPKRMHCRWLPGPIAAGIDGVGRRVARQRLTRLMDVDRRLANSVS